MPQAWHTEEHGFVKKCCKCDVVYLPSQFQHTQRNLDGLQNRCKWCRKEDVAKIAVNCNDERMKHCLESGLDPSDGQLLWEEMFTKLFHKHGLLRFRAYDGPCKVRYPEHVSPEILDRFGAVMDCDGNVTSDGNLM